MRKMLLLSMFLFVVFLSNAYAETIVQANITLTLEELLYVSNPASITSAQIFYPFADNVVDVYTKGACVAQVENGFLKIKFDNLGYGNNSCKALVKVESYFKVPLPENVPWKKEDALKETEHITFEKEVSVLGNLIMDRCKDDFWCKVKEGVKEVHAFLQYDATMSDKNYDVKTIVSKRKGVCAEYVSLFMALMRYMRIPAVYASSYAFNGEYYEPHAYAYVFNDGDRKWYPVDVLWKQIGYADASHIFVGWSYDNRVKSEMKLESLQQGAASWLKESMVVDSYDFKKINLFETSVDKVFKNEENIYVLLVSLKSSYSPACGEVNVVPCSYDSLSEKSAIMCVGENYNFSFNIPLSQKKGYVLTCPFNIYDPEQDSFSYNVTISSSSGSSFSFKDFFVWLANLFKAVISLI